MITFACQDNNPGCAVEDELEERDWRQGHWRKVVALVQMRDDKTRDQGDVMGG